MKLMISFLAWAVLLCLLYIAGLVVAADGWVAGGVFLLGTVLFAAVMGAIYNFLAGLFTCRKVD